MAEIGGRDYEVVIGSDVLARDGMFLEVNDTAGQLLEVFYSDTDGSLTFSAFRNDLPLALVEWAIAEGKARLTPTS